MTKLIGGNISDTPVKNIRDGSAFSAGGAAGGGYLNLGEGWKMPVSAANGGDVTGLSFGRYEGQGSGFSMATLGPGTTNYFAIMSYQIHNNNRGGGGNQIHTLRIGPSGSSLNIGWTAEGTNQGFTNCPNSMIIFEKQSLLSVYTSDYIDISVVYASSLDTFAEAGWDTVNNVIPSTVSTGYEFAYTANTNGAKIWFCSVRNHYVTRHAITDSGGLIQVMTGYNNSLDSRCTTGIQNGFFYLPPNFGWNIYNGIGQIAYELL